jgi:hypothetical protein
MRSGKKHSNVKNVSTLYRDKVQLFSGKFQFQVGKRECSDEAASEGTAFRIFENDLAPYRGTTTAIRLPLI